ncbi:hypothetical protein V6N11_059849 [Hibiscus sabdariffa]|uniref:Uncharacterized protein n=1 Tax=Hibiscus sabdariffa TaxID=183260 RepID=A0ABR2NYM2_9ROSI
MMLKLSSVSDLDSSYEVSRYAANTFVSMCSISSNPSKTEAQKIWGNQDQKSLLFPITKMKIVIKASQQPFLRRQDVVDSEVSVRGKKMVVEEDDPNWPLDADVGWGNGASEYFEHHAIKTVVGEDGSEIDWEGEIDDSWGNSQLEDFERAREGNPGISECQGPIAISGSQTGYQVLREIWHMLLKSGNAPRFCFCLETELCTKREGLDRISQG